MPSSARLLHSHGVQVQRETNDISENKNLSLIVCSLFRKPLSEEAGLSTDVFRRADRRIISAMKSHFKRQNISTVDMIQGTSTTVRDLLQQRSF